MASRKEKRVVDAEGQICQALIHMWRKGDRGSCFSGLPLVERVATAITEKDWRQLQKYIIHARRETKGLCLMRYWILQKHRGGFRRRVFYR